MAKKFASLITEEGKALIAAAIAGGDTISLKYFAVGDGNGAAVIPTTSQTALVNEVARVEINSLKETDATKQIIAVEAVISVETGGFWIREAGVFTDDGKLVAVSQMAEVYKPSADEGASSTQTIRMLLAVSDTSTVNLTVDDTTVIATESYVNEQLEAHKKSRDHPDGTLEAKGFVQLDSSIESDDETRAATPKAVKTANDNANDRLKATENLDDVEDKAQSLKNIGGVPTTRKINDHDLSADIDLAASDVGAFPAEGGTVGSKGVETPHLHINGAPEPASQGLHPGWNRSNGQGEANLVINPGGGVGGLTIIQVNQENTAVTWTVTMGADGSIHSPANLNAGDAYLATDGNIHGGFWGGYISDWITAQINTVRTSADLGAGWWKDNVTGYMRQNGVATKDGGSYVGGVTFPTAFPNICKSITANPAVSLSADSSTSNIQIHDVTTTGFTYTTGTKETAIYWQAEGY